MDSICDSVIASRPSRFSSARSGNSDRTGVSSGGTRPCAWAMPHSRLVTDLLIERISCGVAGPNVRVARNRSLMRSSLPDRYASATRRPCRTTSRLWKLTAPPAMPRMTSHRPAASKPATARLDSTGQPSSSEAGASQASAASAPCMPAASASAMPARINHRVMGSRGAMSAPVGSWQGVWWPARRSANRIATEGAHRAPGARPKLPKRGRCA